MLSFLQCCKEFLLCIVLGYIIVLLYQSGTVLENSCYGY